MAKAKFGPRSKAERKQKSQNVKAFTAQDSNASEIASLETQTERAERKKALRNALQAEQDGRMSSKKRKRLDKYIETKLRKEETAELLKKLATTKSDTSFLHSSKNLGKPANSNIAARPVEGNGKLRRQDATSDESDGSESSTNEQEPVTSRKRTTEAVSRSTVGGGLKRPLEAGLFGGPIIRKRQRLQPARVPAVDQEGSDSSWGGVSSDDEGTDNDKGDLAAEDMQAASSESDLGTTSDSSDEEGAYSGDETSDDDQDVESLAASIFAAVEKRRAEKEQTDPKPSRDLSGFKEWATQQINEARDFVPSRSLDQAEASAQFEAQKKLKFEPRAPEQDELPDELRAPLIKSTRQAYAVHVERPGAIQDIRLKLPIVAEEQRIMECIHNNPTTIVCGATGSGKTTQVPQFLFEAGYGDANGPTPGMIAVTQPRRVAAVTMARRVSQEMGNAGHKVAYQIRYGSTVGKDTVLKFMTDGILIREIASDFALMKYSAIVIDEAHERSVNTDILIGMLSRIVNLRGSMNQRNPDVKPLKLIIMSATLMVEAFTRNQNLFKNGAPPLVQSEGRQFSVAMHFARRTQRDYLDETFKKVLRGHKKLPPGAILVFLTGENEIIALARRLKEALGKSTAETGVKVQVAATEAPLEAEDFDTEKKHEIMTDDEESDNRDDHDDEKDEFDVEPDAEDANRTVDDALILPLYSKLPTKDQLRVFEPPSDNTRLIVLSTNVAETSITIPGVRYVFDCGRSKEKRYNQNTGVQSFEIDWISKASASQRAGRAGRTGPGHCYRLYSSALYERDFADHTEPEVLRMPVEGVVLQLKSMDLQHVARFPFPTPPDQHAIIKAEKLLSYLGAIDSAGKVSNIGRDLSLYPLSPRYAKMLAVGHQQDCMLLTVAMVAALATPELFIPENQINTLQSGRENEIRLDDGLAETPGNEQQMKAYRRAHHMFSGLDNQSDALKVLSAFAAYQYAIATEQPEAFCKRNFLRSKSMKEASQLFQQLLRIVSDNRAGLVDPSTRVIPKANEKQVKALRQFVAVGFTDQVAIRADLAPIPPDLPRGRRATEVPYLTLFSSHDGRVTTPEEGAVYIHASSVLASCKVADMPQYLIYSHLQQGTAASIEGSRAPKIRLHPLTPVTASQLIALAKGTPLLEYGKPIGKIEHLAGSVDERICWVVPSLTGHKGTTAWPLPAKKVVQVRGAKGSWEVEKVLS